METTIQFEDNLKHAKSSIDESDGIGIGGVYSMRKRPSSLSRRNSIDVSHEKTLDEDEDPGLRDENDYKRKQVSMVRLLPSKIY
jgi:hypothetical protein